MDVHTNIPLKNYTTMRLGGNARFMTEVRTETELIEVYKNAKANSLRVFILGGGSNVIARDEGFDGIVIRIRIPGFDISQTTYTQQPSNLARAKIGMRWLSGLLICGCLESKPCQQYQERLVAHQFKMSVLMAKRLLIH